MRLAMQIACRKFFECLRLCLSGRGNSPQVARAAKCGGQKRPFGVFTLHAHVLNVGACAAEKFLPHLVCMLRRIATLASSSFATSRKYNRTVTVTTDAPPFTRRRRS